MEMEKTFNPQAVESEIYRDWESSGAFEAHRVEGKKPFTIVMPPPNITGQLHMGHALDCTLQDLAVRYHRMKGDPTLWLPGTDHAAIATEVKIVDAMRKEGLTKESLGRKGFLDRAWKWKEEYGGRIVTQQRRMGISCDWSRERFTMDEGCSKAVREVFVRLYEKGLIYRGNRLVNWCPCCESAISDAEVEYQEKEGNFWHLLYPVKETGEMLELATTRPETMLGDTAVAINAADPRYAHLHGCHVLLPLANREIPIICDEHADMEKGTGVVKITPAHDPNDNEVAQRHDLPVVRVFTYDGHMTGAEDAAKDADGQAIDCGKYAGMTTLEARKAIVADLQELGLLKSIEPLTHEVGTCYRCHTVIEPMVSRQWFVKMKPLAEPAIACVKSGETKFVPERFTKQYMNWMENIRDWCISRQLWWGHRIPAYYCQNKECGHTEITLDGIDTCPKCGAPMKQDEDTLDTWFSSALWPFSTLGWPEKTADLEYFYPTNTLVTGYDIIPFWVARMIFSGLEHTGQKPFKDVLIHGLVRDELGRKMSKSLGNGVDPLEVIDKYGADALRLTLVTGNAPGNDMRWTETKVTNSRNFANKLWNASRYILMNLPEDMQGAVLPENLPIEDKWILSLYNDLIKNVTSNLDSYELGVAVQNLFDFIWDVYCDWYIELTKPRIADGGETARAAQNVLVYVMQGILKLLHPFMPFITEEIWQSMPIVADKDNNPESIMISAWPVYDEKLHFAAEQTDFTKVVDAIRAIRVQRNELNVPPSKKVTMHIETAETALFEGAKAFFERLAGAGELTVSEKAETSDDMVTIVTANARVFMPMGELVDKEKELARLEKERKAAQKDIDFLSGKLSNQGFLSKAPAQQIENERVKLAKAQEKMEKIMLSIEKMK